MKEPHKKKDSHQEQLHKLQCQVEALQEQLRRAQRLATVGTMAAMVAHEFNNILTPIVNYAQLARANPDLAPKAIARAADGGRRATTICKAILDIAREGPTQPVICNLRRLIQQTVAAMAREPQKDCIELTLDCPEDLSLVTRPVELQQVLLNLLINARSAVMSRPGLRRIDVQAARDGAGVTLRVADNGVGIAPENLTRIFEPFFTTKAAGDPDGGSGLGLAICRQIVTEMGGQIVVDSRPGQGAAFTLSLPASLTAAA